MNPILRVLAPNEPPMEYLIEREVIRVGRSEGNDIVVATPQVSAIHLELKREGDDFRLIDRESTNGTRVNGERVSNVVLRDGDEIVLGRAVVILYSHAVSPKLEPVMVRPSAKLPSARPPIKIAKPMPPGSPPLMKR
ncbi:MAG: FHA domain-containing protein [Verrucomicrobiae bacterium]|nr:FHA domain-containing protein [Verrucomicrobiae bacterium]